MCEVIISAIILNFIGILSIFYLYVEKKRNYWKNNGIPHERPKSIIGISSKKGKEDNIILSLSKYYAKAKNNGFPFYGVYLFHKPTIIATDMDFIRMIMVTDFGKFMNRGTYSNEKDDPLSGDLIRLESHRWKEMRSKLTPTFTSCKMKFMYPSIVSVGEKLVTCSKEIIKTDNIVEIEDLASRFTTDIIGNVGFGIECNSLEDPNNIFRQMGKKIFEKPELTIAKRIIANTFGPLARMFHVIQ